MVSSSGDEGTQRLVAEAPDLVIPSLRPYRNRGEIGTWVRDDTVATFLEERLAKSRYAAIGEFHLYGADADLPVPRRMVALAKQHKLILHAHSDIDAIERIYRQDPQARILWAHSGFDAPDKVREMLRKHPNLWCDLAFRSEHGASGKIPPEWKRALHRLPRSLHGRHRHLHAGALALHRAARGLVARVARGPARAAGGEASRGATAKRSSDRGSRPRKRSEPLHALGRRGHRSVARRARLVAKRAIARRSSRSCHRGGGPRAGVRRIARRRRKRVDNPRYSVVYRTVPAPVAVGQHFAVDFAVCPKAGAAAPQRSARRRQHARAQARHELPHQVVRSRDGTYRAEGLLFHMPGRWDLTFDVIAGSSTERLASTLDVR